MSSKDSKIMKRILEELEVSPSLYRDFKLKRRKFSDFNTSDASSVVSSDSGVSSMSSQSDQDRSPNSCTSSANSSTEGNEGSYSGENSGDNSGDNSLSSMSSTSSLASMSSEDAMSQNGEVGHGSLTSLVDETQLMEQKCSSQKQFSVKKGDIPMAFQMESSNATLNSNSKDIDIVTNEEKSIEKCKTQEGDLSRKVNFSTNNHTLQHGSLASQNCPSLSPLKPSLIRDQMHLSSSSHSIENIAISPSVSPLPRRPVYQDNGQEDLHLLAETSEQESVRDEGCGDRRTINRSEQEEFFQNGGHEYDQLEISQMQKFEMSQMQNIKKLYASVTGFGCMSGSFPPEMPWRTRSMGSKQQAGQSFGGHTMIPVVNALPASAIPNSYGEKVSFPILNVSFPKASSMATTSSSREVELFNSMGLPTGTRGSVTRKETSFESQFPQGPLCVHTSKGITMPCMSFNFNTEESNTPLPILNPPFNQSGSRKSVTLDWNYLNEVQRRQTDHIKKYDKNGQIKEEDTESLSCEICLDHATGLHYGIITCEGCKGFFKRTVQNKRVYTCVRNGDCIITKAQRNRCQYCRFKKCMEKGMVLAAVREDRMPGGRNSGAIYNGYKVKYKRQRQGHDTKTQNGQSLGLASPSALICRQMPQNLNDHSLLGSSKDSFIRHSSSSKVPRSTNSGLWQHNVTRADDNHRLHTLPPGPPIYSLGSNSTGPPTHRLLSGSKRLLTQKACSNPTGSPIYTPGSGTNNSQTIQWQPQYSHPSTSSFTSPMMSPASSIPPNASTYKTQCIPDSTPSSFTLSVAPLSMKTSWMTYSSSADECRRNLQHLLSCEKSDSIMLYRLPMTMEQDISEILCKLGDDIVSELVVWLKQLPLYEHLSSSTHSHIMTSKWHELLLLATTIHQADTYLRRNGSHNLLSPGLCHSDPMTKSMEGQIQKHMVLNMEKLHQYLTQVLHQELSLQQMYDDMGDMMEKITTCIYIFQVLKVTREEYVCLKVILLLTEVNSLPDAKAIHEARTAQIEILRCYEEHNFPNQPNRFKELMLQLPRIQEAASLLLKDRMIYLPFLFNNLYNW